MDGDGTLHEEDFYAWTQVQAEKLRQAAEARVNLDLDFGNLIEEVEGLGRSEQDAAESALMRVIEHLLKLEHSPAEGPRRGWRLSVLEHRRRFLRKMKQNPSLKAQLTVMLDTAWEDGRALAVAALEMDGVPQGSVPAQRPYSSEQVADELWFPASRHGFVD